MLDEIDFFVILWLKKSNFVKSIGGIFMAFQAVFKRYELKYLLLPEQKDKVLRAMEPYMAPGPS